jgi:hypothetical protein
MGQNCNGVKSFCFPHAAGAIASTHVPTTKPSHYGDKYLNRKGFCSVNIQPMSSIEEVFMCNDIQWPEYPWQQDFEKSLTLYSDEFFARCYSTWVIGYGITPWLLTPYRTPQTMEERAYNRLHSRKCIFYWKALWLTETEVSCIALYNEIGGT